MKILSISKTKLLIILSILLFVGGFVCGYFYFSRVSTVVKTDLNRLRLNSPDLTYINPLLVCENSTDKKMEYPEYKQMSVDLNNIINDYKKRNGVYEIGLFYKELLNGKWVGINEDEKFSPGSLQKVPLMIAYYKLSEYQPEILKTILINDLDKDLNLSQTVKPEKSINFKETASVEDLIKLMIAYSDNNASQILFNNIDHNLLKEVFSSVGIDFSEDQTRRDYVSPRQFSLFFRILYNSTYLNWYNSEQSLAIMNQVSFRDGLVAGVGQGVAVSHKFGESFDASESKQGGYPPEQLHDCGIVYYPNNPYVLCVMTKGSTGSIEDLKSAIKSISDAVYKDVEKRYPSTK